MVNKVVLGFMPIILGLGLSACSPIPPLQPGAANVVLSHKKPDASCEQITVITSEQEPVSSSITAPQLQQGAMNELRNGAAQQHANYIYILNNYSKLKQTSNGNYAPNDVAAIIMRGIAYRCPEDKLHIAE